MCSLGLDGVCSILHFFKLFHTEHLKLVFTGLLLICRATYSTEQKVFKSIAVNNFSLQFKLNIMKIVFLTKMETKAF
jgi:hypothetical protein